MGPNRDLSPCGRLSELERPTPMRRPLTRREQLAAVDRILRLVATQRARELTPYGVAAIAATLVGAAIGRALG